MNDDNENSEPELDLTRESIVLPDFKAINFNEAYNYSEEIVDYETVETLNRTINQARMALFKTNDRISKYERLEKKSKLKYERAHRRALLQSTAKTVGDRKARADIFCEELENEWITNLQIKEEMIRFSYTLRLELETLQTIGNNLRQQLRI